MEKIITLLNCLKPVLSTKHLKKLIIVVHTLLLMQGRKTILGLSRWSSKGGSARTLSRFFGSNLNWQEINWQIIRTHLRRKGRIYILGGDEVIVSKSGKKSYGVDLFYSSIQNQVIRSLAFLNISLIDTEGRKAYPIIMEQIVKESKDGCVKDKTKKIDNGKKRKVGRPKGSTNKSKEDVELSPYLKFVQKVILGVTKQIDKNLDIVYFVYDGAFGNNKAVQMVKRAKLQIISKLKRNSALYFPYEGERNCVGAPKKYGDKIDYEEIPDKYLVSRTISLKTNKRTDIYQLKMIHKKFASTLNVVVIQKKDFNSGKISNVNLFSTDLDLSPNKMIDYYSLRFQIEFVFRDAKQHWGLEDFMNTKKKPIYNWANLSVFMVNISHILRKNNEMKDKSVLDLRAHYHGLKYLDELFKLLPHLTNSVLIKRLSTTITNLGAIHPVKSAA